MMTLHCPVVTYEFIRDKSDKPGASYAWFELTSLALSPFRIVTNAVPGGVASLHLTSMSGSIIFRAVHPVLGQMYTCVMATCIWITCLI